MTSTTAASRRNVLILTVCLALNMTAVSVMVVVSAIVGQMLAENKALATLPFSLQFVGTMAASIPASLLMRRMGRRFGFTVGAAIGVFAGIMMTAAIYLGDFWLFTLGNALIGAANGFAQLYRFAAAEAADDAFRPKAISLVLCGGIAAAIFGPELAKWSRALLDPYNFAGCFVVIVALGVAAAMLVQTLRIPPLTLEERRDHGRPLLEIVRQPTYLVALLGAVVAYSVMIMVMTATPLAMLACGLVFDDAAFVIQWHALGMFAPSFVTGWLIVRFGILNIMMTGVLLFAGCFAAALLGTDVAHFWAANLMLGIGWNFLFIGASTLLTETYRPSERAKAQAFNDFVVFGVVAIASLAGGILHELVGWAAVNIGGIVPAAAVLAGLLWLRAHCRARVAAA
jgi:MFS family permease